MVSGNHCVYVKKTNVGIMFLTLYVDNILLAGNDMKMIKTTKKWLSSVFEMKDLGEAKYVIGVEITQNHSKKLLGLSQEAYTNKILECFQIHYCKPVATSVEKGPTLSLDHYPKTDKEKRE